MYFQRTCPIPPSAYIAIHPRRPPCPLLLWRLRPPLIPIRLPLVPPSRNHLEPILINLYNRPIDLPLLAPPQMRPQTSFVGLAADLTGREGVGWEGFFTLALALSSEIRLEFASFFERLFTFASFEVAFEGVWKESSPTFFTRNKSLLVIVGKCEFIIGFFI